ncbi:MAG: agmatinase [Polyangiales bacterium]
MKHPFRPVSPREVPRFSGVSTFLRLPRHDDPRDVDVMIVGAPFDGGTSFRPGARFGPRGVREASALTRGFHPGPDVDLFDVLRCADGGDVLCVPMDTARSLNNIEARVREVAMGGAIPALVGGDHTCTLPALRALAKVHGPLGLIHFDAHSDTYPPAWDIDPHHGTVFRNAMEEGHLRAGDVLQIGIRGPFSTRGDLSWAESHGFTVLTAEAAHRDLDAVIARIEALPRDRLYYLSFDVDAVDPSMAPGTGTPVPGGIFSWQALALVRAAARLPLVGCDVMEVAPDFDLNGITALLAANVLGEALAGVASQRERR